MIVAAGTDFGTVLLVVVVFGLGVETGVDVCLAVELGANVGFGVTVALGCCETFGEDRFGDVVGFTPLMLWLVVVGVVMPPVALLAEVLLPFGCPVDELVGVVDSSFVGTGEFNKPFLLRSACSLRKSGWSKAPPGLILSMPSQILGAI